MTSRFFIVSHKHWSLSDVYGAFRHVAVPKHHDGANSRSQEKSVTFPLTSPRLFLRGTGSSCGNDFRPSPAAFGAPSCRRVVPTFRRLSAEIAVPGAARGTRTGQGGRRTELDASAPTELAMGAVASALKEEVIAYSYLARLVKQLLLDPTVRSKTTLLTFFSGFMSIAVDEMIHQSQCRTCEDGWVVCLFNFLHVSFFNHRNVSFFRS